jgi:hypothetical protein
LFKDCLPPGVAETIFKDAQALINEQGKVSKFECQIEALNDQSMQRPEEYEVYGELFLQRDFPDNFDNAANFDGEIPKEDIEWAKSRRIEESKKRNHDTMIASSNGSTSNLEVSNSMRKSRDTSRASPPPLNQASHQGAPTSSSNRSGKRFPSYIDATTGKKIIDFGSGGLRMASTTVPHPQLQSSVITASVINQRTSSWITPQLQIQPQIATTSLTSSVTLTKEERRANRKARRDHATKMNPGIISITLED